MANTPLVVEVALAPVSPDTLASIREDLRDVTRKALAKSDQAHLLDDGDLQVEIEGTFPDATGVIIQVIVTLSSGIAVQAFKLFVLDSWAERWHARVTRGSDELEKPPPDQPKTS